MGQGGNLDQDFIQLETRPDGLVTQIDLFHADPVEGAFGRVIQIFKGPFGANLFIYLLLRTLFQLQQQHFNPHLLEIKKS
jgi:hypothetical protein